METDVAQELAYLFEDKSESELEALSPPLWHTPKVLQWQRARLAAIAALRSAREAAAEDDARLATAPEESARTEDSAPQNCTDDIEDGDEDDAPEDDDRARTLLEAPRANQPKPPPNRALVLPEGDAAQLLEQQLAASAALIRHLSGYVARDDTDPAVCVLFMDRMTSMLGASANVGKVVGRLRGHVSRTEQLISVNHGKRGRG